MFFFVFCDVICDVVFVNDKLGRHKDERRKESGPFSRLLHINRFDHFCYRNVEKAK